MELNKIKIITRQSDPVVIFISTATSQFSFESLENLRSDVCLVIFVIDFFGDSLSFFFKEDSPLLGDLRVGDFLLSVCSSLKSESGNLLVLVMPRALLLCSARSRSRYYIKKKKN